MNCDRCEACGASLKHHRHTLNRHHVEALTALAAAGGRASRHDLTLSGSAYSELARLRHFGLAEPLPARAGWLITELGRAFLIGEATVPAYVDLYRGQKQGESAERVDVQTAAGQSVVGASL